MPCYNPISAYRSKEVNNNGKRSIVFDEKLGNGLPIKLPCGRCIGCRLNNARDWAIRCMHESLSHEDNYFITLTYDDDKMDKKCGIYDEETKQINQWSLNKREFQLFIKRLRKEYGNGIKFFQCGEYGETSGRPHHHACMFGIKINDLELWKSCGGTKLYTSESITKIWGNGYVVIGEVTFESAMYVSKYITKKITGPKAEKYYDGLQPEYSTMSRRPGLGAKYYEKYGKRIMNNDAIYMSGGIALKVPRYYNNKYEVEEPEKMEELKERRLSNVNKKENTVKRLAERKEWKTKTLKQFRRNKAC